MIFCGIDPGFGGGIGAVDQYGKHLYSAAFTKEGNDFDASHLNDCVWSVREIDKDVYFMVEKVSAMPKQGVTSMFRFGDVFGQIKGVLTVHRCRWDLVRPHVWMKVIHQGPTKGDTKGKSIAIAKRLFPEQDFLANKRCRTPHTGIVDALLIAEYTRRVRVGQINAV